MTIVQNIRKIGKLLTGYHGTVRFYLMPCNTVVMHSQRSNKWQGVPKYEIPMILPVKTYEDYLVLIGCIDTREGYQGTGIDLSQIGGEE